MFIIYVRKVIDYYNLLLFTNKMAIDNFKVDIEVQITSLNLKEKTSNVGIYLKHPLITFSF